MRCKRIGAICALAAAAAWSSLTYAQPAPSADPRALEREQASLQQQIAAKQRELETLRAQPAPEQAELTAARQAADQARAAHRSAPGADTEAKLKNAEFKLTLVERKYNKANSETDTLADEVEQLQQQLAASRRRSAALTQQAAAQQSEQNRAQQQRLAEERAARDRQQQELTRTRQEADAAQREIERLKALLAQKEAAASPAAASPAPAAKPAAATTVPVAPAAKPVAAVAAAKPAAASEAGGLRRLSNQQEVLQELRTLELRLTDVESNRRDVNEILYLKRLQNGAEVGKSMLTLKALGQQQYRGSSKIDAGHFQLVLGLNSWPAEFSAAESGASFVFLYDNSDPKKPRLLMYNSALESGN